MYSQRADTSISAFIVFMRDTETKNIHKERLNGGEYEKTQKLLLSN